MYVFALSFNWFTGFVASYLLLLKNFKGKLSTEKYKEKNGGYRWAVNEVMQLLTIGLEIYLIIFAIFFRSIDRKLPSARNLWKSSDYQARLGKACPLASISPDKWILLQFNELIT